MGERARDDGLEQARTMTLDEALVDLSNRVCAAAGVFENLEHAERIVGNGHHMGQALAVDAQVRLLRSWANAAEVGALSPTHPAVEQMERENAKSRVLARAIDQAQ